MLDPHHLDDPVSRAAQRHQMELFRPVDPYSQHITLPRHRLRPAPHAGKGQARTGAAGRSSPREAPRRADRQSSQDNTLVGVRPPGPSPRDAVSIKSSKDKRPKRSPGETLTQEGSDISARLDERP